MWDSRAARGKNDVREGLRGAPLLGVVVDLMFGWLFDISWLVVSVKSSA
jgi:hypothetical protein